MRRVRQRETPTGLETHPPDEGTHQVGLRVATGVGAGGEGSPSPAPAPSSEKHTFYQEEIRKRHASAGSAACRSITGPRPRVLLSPANFGRRELGRGRFGSGPAEDRGAFAWADSQSLEPIRFEENVNAKERPQARWRLGTNLFCPEGASAACDAVPASLARAICHHPADRYERRERGRTCASRRSL